MRPQEFEIRTIYLSKEQVSMIKEIHKNFEGISFSELIRYIIKYYYDKEININNRGGGENG